MSITPEEPHPSEIVPPPLLSASGGRPARGNEFALAAADVGGERASIALREQRGAIVSLSSHSMIMAGVVTRVVGLIHEFVTRVHLELQFSDAQSEMFETTRQDVDARLALLGGDALTKISSINERFRAGDPESVSSHAMTTARRLIDSIADAVFPGRAESYAIGKGGILGRQLKGAESDQRISASEWRE